ncbi:centrosomal protein 20-like [Halichondria panicea]|uniref:centrosomal protein 20-like n=1 Tax=Halichondria panicea TaxID=6063 RepID=UPI00312B3507
MAEQELRTALKDVLEKRGVLSEVQARIRAEVYKALQDDSVSKPELCEENLLINELIREYLQFNQYKYTDSVLVAETGQHKEPLERGFLAKQLHIPLTDHPGPNNIPLLYHMLGHFLRKPTLPDPLSEQLDVQQKPTMISLKARSLESQCVIEQPLFTDS